MAKRFEDCDLFPGALESVIVESPNRRPTHGSAFAHCSQDISGDLLQIEEGSFDPALQRMLKTGWPESEMELSASKRPVRIFQVTEAGRKRLDEELSSFEKMF
jgi:DNA-binding PadR family transcriptional regulator